jgi:hypothetical protein
VVAVRLPAAQAQRGQGTSLPVAFEMALQGAAAAPAAVQLEQSTFWVPR